MEAVLGLANTIHGPGGHYRRRARPTDPAHDHLETPERAAEFLSTHRVPVPDTPATPADLVRLRRIRDLARDLSPAGGRLAEADWAEAVRVLLADGAYRLAPDGTLRAAAAGWSGVVDDLLPGLLALREVRDRIRVCGNPLCRWLFVDRSRNRSRRWCEMAVCGNRVKVGRHRHRLLAGEGGPGSGGPNTAGPDTAVPDAAVPDTGAAGAGAT